MHLFLFAALLGGCRPKAEFQWDTGNSVEDTADTADTSTDSADSDDSSEMGCSNWAIDALGPEEPVVGDSWTIWLSCDDARVVGPIVISWDPGDFVELEDNVATFLYAGEATLYVSTGRVDLEKAVTVTEATAQ